MRAASSCFAWEYRQVTLTASRTRGWGTEEATGRIIAMARKAVEAGKPVQVSVQSAFGCGFEGVIPEERVLGIVRTFLASGLRTISLADTAGFAQPDQVRRLFGAVRDMDSSAECTCHFHDTYGLGMVNACAAMEVGVKSFEIAFAGLGGCPFTALTAGNLCSENFLYYLQRTHQRRDIALAPLLEVSRQASRFFGRSASEASYRMPV